MTSEQLISTTLDQFMNRLKNEGMMIVPADTFRRDMELKLKQDWCLKQKSLTCQQIIKAKLLPIKSRNSIVNWTKNGTLKPNEFYHNSKGVLMVLTVAILRLRR